MPSTPSADDEVEGIVAECLLAEDLRAAEEEACRRHPHLAEKLRGVLRQVERLDLISRRADAVHESMPERLGSFRLLRRLGAGGMGVVYLAHDEALSRKVALKLIRPELLYFPGNRERFQREVEAVARLNHPGIVPVFTVGKENGVPYYSMELIDGRSIDAILTELEKRDPATLTGSDLLAALSGGAAAGAERTGDGLRRTDLFGGSWVDACLRVALQVAEALQHAHEQGVLHRDVKPSNILLTREGRARLVDFGLARTEGAVRLTRSGTELGSVVYMAPEQVRGEATDRRTDVYALGVTFYEMLTLRAPYLASDHEGTRRLILDARPVRPRERNRAVSWEVETLCLAAMDRDPQRRYPTALAFASDLLNVLEHRPITARAPGVPLKLRRWSQRHPAATVALLLCALAVVLGPIVYGFLLAKERDDAIAARNEAVKAGNEAIVARNDALKLTQEKVLQTYLGNVGAVGYGLRYLRPAEARARLAECSEGLRGFEWSHLWLKCDASVAAIPAHEAGVRRVAFGRDGEILVSGSLDGTVAVWNVATRELVRRFTAGAQVLAVAVSPDGKLVAAGAGKAVVVWDLESGEERSRFEEHEQPVFAVCFTPDGKLVSGAPDKTIVVRDLASGEVRKAAAGGMVASLAVSGDGRRLAVGSRGPVFVLDLTTLVKVGEIDAHSQFVFGVAFDREGKQLLTGSQDGSAALWEVETGRRLLRIADHDADVGDVAFSADGKEIVTGSSDSMLRVFDVRTGVLSRTYHGHDLAVYGIAVARDGRLIASGSGDGTVRLWNAAGPRDEMAVTGHVGAVRQVAASADSKRLVSAGSDRALRVTEVETGRLVGELVGHEGGVTAGVFDGSGERVWSASEDGTIRAWSMETKRVVSRWVCEGWIPRCLVVAGGKVYSGGSDGHVRGWEMESAGGSGSGNGSGNGSGSGRVIDDFAAHDGEVRALLAAGDGGKVYSAGADGKVMEIDVGGGVGSGRARKVVGLGKQVVAIAIGAGGRELFAAVGTDVDVVDVASGKVVRKLVGHHSEVRAVVVSPDGRRVVSGSMDRMLRVWDAETGVSLLTLHGHRDGVQALVWSVDGKWVASGSVFGSVIVWRG